VVAADIDDAANLGPAFAGAYGAFCITLAFGGEQRESAARPL
jgi:uncharacterized protein YbjT (DUF2867 family)